MSLTIVMVVLSGCKEPNDSSPKQTSETKTDENVNSPSDSNVTKPEETTGVQDAAPTVDLPVPELKAQIKDPELPDAQPEVAPEVPELDEPALPDAEPEVAPEVPELDEPALPDAEPETTSETPELEAPALPETEPEVAPEVPELEAPALPETESEVAPEVPELEAPALPETEPKVAPEVPELEAPALPETEPEVTPEVPELEAPALPETEPEVAPEAPAIPDVLQTEDMDLAELPDSAAGTQKTEATTQPEKKASVQPNSISPKPTQTQPAEQKAEQTTPPAEPKELVNPETLKNADTNPTKAPQTLDAPADAKVPADDAPKWESKNNATTDLNALKNDASKLVQSEMQKLDDSLDLNLVEPADTTESRVIPPPPKKNAADASEPSDVATDVPASQPNNPLLEDIPQKQNGQTDNIAETPQTTANQPNEIVKPPFDPIKENGPIFVGWGVPRVALVITGQQNGYLEPCGCAGLDRMKGGLSRRYSFIKGLRDKGWPVIALDVGGMCNSFGKQAELKFHTTASALRAMGYNAIALGKAELGFPAADILSEIVNADGTPGMFVSANVSVFERDAGMPPTYKILQANGLKFGITSVLCKSAQNFSQNDEILLSPTKESLNKVMPILKEKSDIRILLSHGTVEEALKIANDYPDFQVIVTAGGNPEPPAKPVILPSGQYIITVGQKGMCSIVLGFFEKGVLKYQRVPHDSRFEQSDVVRQMMQSYQDQLKELWLDGLGIRPVPQTDQTRGANVGPKKCQTCHEYQYDVWKKSKHAHAFKSLEDAKPARDFDPECVCCHVVGWHRHLYFPYQKGYVKPGEDDHLKNVSCEACHGPGEAHIAAESSSNVENQKAQREKLHIDLKFAKEKMCGDCHDLDNSPNFDPDKYWELIKHPEPED